VSLAATRLSDAQLNEAEAIFRRPEGQPRALSFYVEFALGNYREPVTRKILSEAVVPYQGLRTMSWSRTCFRLCT